ncbi:glycosyltransferase family 39 protein [Mixia osmundae IAM 14324]|uniref:Dolichyl-phosphate-mannose--protein mannosyltransferase n=1 Tax=Mixia osmundae (strain CBS 9802 / IAM 14324 / JCM 22182 / KY 12970) TaxID=764103 RepID=G7E9E9_MIXOS|nr:glycosyltransferase family 39 protein [Mixia osmundae IAM 14324]KEI39898.1 glycosyltransferase family 39 protein [Mixia osmundae IAM 14324]GAA99268.1 hypothetical protein E5Q_05962 [Mixia osmundae IAM 14324]
MASAPRARRPLAPAIEHTGLNGSSDEKLTKRGTVHVETAAPLAKPQGGLATGWLAQPALKGKGKRTSAVQDGGPLDFLGGGLEVLSAGEVKVLVGVLLLACWVRLWHLDRPSSVVFDEVHFGGFASKYLKSKFFMDVHPPLAKLLITLAGFVSGFDGNFDFKEIGMSYKEMRVPYIAMRMLPATLGIMLVPLAYFTLRILACRPTTALMASLLVTFENGLITQSRHILLDSPLIFFTALTAFAWCGFAKEDERRSFTPIWWSWLTFTGVALGAVVSCKWVGLFTIATIGLATIKQLWDLLGNLRVSLPLLVRHFIARAICLILIPCLFYASMFGLHFAVLSNSGEGDGFMSSEFQHSLRGHGMENTFADVYLGSRITIKHLNTQGGYLHSHAHMYPGGSHQQQITLYPHRDENNDWIVSNVTAEGAPKIDFQTLEQLVPIMDRTVLRFEHATTGKRLHSHDVRPPVSEVDWQNEVSGYGFEGFDGDVNDHFAIEIDPTYTDSSDKLAKKQIRSLRTKFRLRHTLTGCYLFSHKVKLPEWGFEQQEVTCNKNPSKANSIWYVETNSHPQIPADAATVNYKGAGFWSKFFELNAVMWQTNQGLTDRHAYDSRPQSWPALKRGINFWVKDHRQIYLIGNPVIWWSSTLAVLLYAAVRALIFIRAKRGFQDLNNTSVAFYDGVCGFLAMGWALHYFPFFLMNRQLFLHHYFPALYFAILMLAAIFDAATSRLAPRYRLGAAAACLLLAIMAWAHWSPLAYAGQWTRGQCESAKLLKSWDFSCSDFPVSLAEYTTAIVPKEAARATPTAEDGVVVDAVVPPVIPPQEAEEPNLAVNFDPPLDPTTPAAVAPIQNAFSDPHAAGEIVQTAGLPQEAAEAEAVIEEGDDSDAPVTYADDPDAIQTTRDESVALPDKAEPTGEEVS